MELAKKRRAEKDKLQRLLGFKECSSNICHDANNFLHFGPDATILPKLYSHWALFIREMAVKSNDTWFISSAPQFGMTWVKELIWLLGNNLNFSATDKNIQERFPHLELDIIQKCFKGLESMTSHDEVTSPKTVDEMTSKRFIQSNLPLTLLPQEFFDKQPKIVYVMRSPKDACVSAFVYSVVHYGYKKDFQNFVQNFTADHSLYAPFWNQVKGFYGLYKNSYPNLLFVTIEELTKDLQLAVVKIAKFMEKEINENDVKKLTNFLREIQTKEDEQEKMAIEKIKVVDFSPETETKFGEWLGQNGISDFI